MTVSEVMACLRVRYRAPSWAFFEEVRDMTGYGHRRTADALAFGLWPSQGLELHGFEVKASRNDWRRERARPEKADSVLGYCDRVWIVTTERSLVPLEELPPIWGLMEPVKDGLRATRLAERNLSAKALDRSFLASLMRQAHRFIEHEIKNGDGSKKAYARGVAAAEISRKCDIDDAIRKKDYLEKAINEFEKASGVRIAKWAGGQVGEAVKIVLTGGLVDMQHRLMRLKEDIERALSGLQ